ncbi:HDOD domain-containing protein [Deferribacteres bacterium DY0037]
MNQNIPSVILMCRKNASCQMLKDTVASLPFDTYICNNEQHAFDILEKQSIDIIITEFDLEESSGISFLQAILERSKQNTRIIFGHQANEEIIIKSIIKGTACAYIDDSTKPELLKKKLLDIARIRADMTNQKILEILPGSNEFPIDMSVYEELMEAINDEKPLPDIATIIAKDITLTAKVLQVANSAFFGSFCGTSIEKAIIYMGMNPVKDIVLLHSLSANLQLNSAQNRELESIVRHSIETNYYMHAIAKKSGTCHITTLNSSIGIIHDIGKLVQLVFFPMEFNSITEYRNDNPNTDYYTCELETGNISLKHSEIGAYFLSCWNFNQYSVEAALYHHEPELATDEMRPCIEALFLANTISDIRAGYNLSLEDALARCLHIDMEPSDILTILPPL